MNIYVTIIISIISRLIVYFSMENLLLYYDISTKKYWHTIVKLIIGVILSVVLSTVVIKLIIEPAVYDFITEKAMEYKLGARGLRSICESLFTQAMFEMPGTEATEFNVTLDYATQMFDKSKLSTLKVA